MRAAYWGFNTDFLDARQFVCDVMGDAVLLMTHEWDAAWEDMFDCWCGCPL